MALVGNHDIGKACKVRTNAFEQPVAQLRPYIQYVFWLEMVHLITVGDNRLR